RSSAIGSGVKKTEAALVAQSVPSALARRIALLPLLGTALHLTHLAEKSGGDIGVIADIFFGLGRRLGLDWLTERARALVVETPWQREAVATILDEFAANHSKLTALIIGKAAKSKKAGASDRKLVDWLTDNAGRIERHDALLNEWRAAGAVDIAMLTLASRQLAALLH
ncbi:MAG TPA: hypothetical protein VMV79_05565, partial [Alphaproteobacteria bacterium]|nr:hypothetical protein [Alphaproteobacteria bacterium]